MTIAEQIYTIAKTLPPEQSNELLTLAESICTKHLKAHPPAEVEQTPWSEFVYSLAGAWADDFPDLEEIRAELI
jgi:hypothetical protein